MHYSCETGLVTTCDDIRWAVERQTITASIAIDLSVAFETVEHDILIDVLEKCFVTQENAMLFFESYLRRRSLYVNVGSCYQSSKALEFSVRQGSYAGPLLYSANITVIKHPWLCWRSCTKEMLRRLVEKWRTSHHSRPGRFDQLKRGWTVTSWKRRVVLKTEFILVESQ